MTAVLEFLPDRDAKRWRPTKQPTKSLEPMEYFVGRGDHALEVALSQASRRPKVADVRKLWSARHGGRASPVLLVVLYPSDGEQRATVCGPVGDPPSVVADLDVGQVERLSDTALGEPDRHAAVRLLTAMLPEVGSDLPGLRNVGLLAGPELANGVPARPDWTEACRRARPLLGLRGRELVEALGFSVQPLGTGSSLLAINGHKRAVAVFLDEGETFDASGARFDGTTAVAHALALADQQSVPWVLSTRGRQIRLYAARPDTGVGRKGRSETFIELNLALLDDDHAGYLDLLFSGNALALDGTIEEILERSEDFAAELGARLRDRVYTEVVPTIAKTVAARLDPTSDELTEADLTDAYDQTLTILFRLLFVAYGEDKALLPYRTNGRYRDHALKTIARRLADLARGGHTSFDARATDLWDDVCALWRGIDNGNADWGVPAYNGGLFSNEYAINPAGAAIAEMSLTNTEFGPALIHLLVDTEAEGVTGPVDFRTLSVREFGTIYEGLLESELSIAPTDLTVDSKGSFVPAKAKDPVEVPAGQIYFHDRSGSRKATGSYFTKPFIVEHLLDQALEPALDDHLVHVTALLVSGDEAGAADALFDFRCVDLAMGSGHFLVAAVDRIEARFSAFLALHSIPPALVELERLRQAALDALGDLADGVEIETNSLLRRQVARRCIYGVDRNRLAVELARLGLWIHTFVPGLPLSFLDHGLVVGSSLTGIGTLEEAVGVIDPAPIGGKRSLCLQPMLDILERSRPALERLARLADSTRDEIAAARAAQAEATEVVTPARRLFDLLVAARLGEVELPSVINERELSSQRQMLHAEVVARDLEALHFPVVFPEIFLRDRPGFDCILGNPPWETIKSEEHKFWSLRFPGLRALQTGEMNREIDDLRQERPDLVELYEHQRQRDDALRAALLSGPYPGIGTGDPDLSEVFPWRFVQLQRSGGWIGVVLPRSVFVSGGSDAWRRELFARHEVSELLTLVNRGGWVFDDAEARYTIALVTIQRTDAAGTEAVLRGPYRSMAEFEASVTGPGSTLSIPDMLQWTPGAAIPLVPSERSVAIYKKLRSHPALSSIDQLWVLRTYNELHSTADKASRGGVIQLDGNPPAGAWPVYKGESFGLWRPSTGVLYGWADPDEAIARLQAKRARQIGNARSAFAGMSQEWAADPGTLPCRRPRVAWRKVARATDTRSFYAVLLPPDTLTADHNYCLFFPDADHERDEAYLLGVMCSIPFDWHARLWVEANFTANIVQPFPVPAVPRNHRIRRRVEILAGRLAAVDERYGDWAGAVGVKVGGVREVQQLDVLAELDAAVAHLYGLNEDDAKVIFETFHVGWDYSPRLEAVLDHFREMA